MTDLFFYGTLRFGPLLQIVLGRDDNAITAIPAALPDHAAHWVRDQPYPMILTRAGSLAQGVLVRGLTEEDIARLVFYEGGFDYDLHPATLLLKDGGSATAQVFFPPRTATGQPVQEPGEPWSLEDWADRFGPLTLAAATEVMAWYRRMSAQEIATRFPSIRRRAWSRLMAQARPADPGHDIARDVQVLGHQRAWLNFYGMDEVTLRFRRHDGSMNEAVNRAALLTGEAVVVLPYDPVRDCVLLVEQFRAPVFLCGDPAPWIWEPVAGLVDPGETPEQTAHREAMEEAGLVLNRLEPAGQVYSSTGSSSEFLHLFIGIVDLDAARTGGGGVDAEGEDITEQVVAFDDLMQGVDARLYQDMPLVTTALWLARHRDRLRNDA